MSEAMKVFELVLDNSQNLSKEINQNVYKILGVNTQDKHLNEFIMAELDSFDYNIVENQLINRIKETINDALKPLENPNENNYEAITSNLMNNLKLLKIQDFRLDNNFRDLSAKLASKFPLSGITQEQFYSHFMSKSEKINEMINQSNSLVIDTLIKFSSQLVSELQQSRNGQSVNNSEPINPNPVSSDYNRKDENKPNTPPPVSTYIGATNEDIEKLIKSNEYYSLLHGIDRESFMKYNGFIQTGFSLITSDYYNRAVSFKTLEERLQALKELKQIHENFNGYITMEQSNQLRETIEKMTNYLQKQQSQHLVDDIGIRYNSARKDETRSSRRM